jgi:carbonic anhydrase
MGRRGHILPPQPSNMPATFHFSSRHLAALMLALGSLCGAAVAAEHASAPSEVAAASAAEPAATATVRKPRRVAQAPAEVRGPQDPMDMLRERLAQKLGTVKVPDPSNPNVVRIVTNAPGPAGSAAAAATEGHRAMRRTPGWAPAANHPAHWDYAGSGSPDVWGRMDPEFAKCATGTRQSPIDIRDGIKVDLDPVQFNYQPSAFSVIDNGHTVQVNVAPGNSIEVLGQRFELVQFHFHRPSEERVDGKQFDMVVHLVHKDARGHLAVVAVLLERGSAQGIVQAVWNNLPLEKGEEVAARGTLNLSDLLPTQRGYYTYMGSLTTPPCSEGVLWMVMKQPVSISPEQIGIFARLYPMNARPVQPLADRMIKESN